MNKGGVNIKAGICFVIGLSINFIGFIYIIVSRRSIPLNIFYGMMVVSIILISMGLLFNKPKKKLGEEDGTKNP